MTTLTIVDGRDIPELVETVAAMLKDWPVRVRLSGQKARSLSQNATFHMWMAEISRWLISHGREFATHEWCKDAMKHTFLGYEDVLDTDVVTGISMRRQALRHTSKLDTGEMKQFMDLVYAWALDKGLPLTIPDGCQYDELNKRENGIE